jgi:hypothetical protein
VKASDPFCISTTGSTRATSYTWSNKIITRDGKTHVVWLDAPATVYGRTYDHSSGEWSETTQIADGSDNHTCPCITMDKDGHIHLTYGPHGWSDGWNQSRVKWKRSAKPGTLAEWEPEGEGYGTYWNNFGYNATAASIVHHPSGLDAVVSRGGENPPQTVFHRQREVGGWTSAKPLFAQNVPPQYTHNYGHITCSPDGTLYTACHFYNIGGSDNTAVTGDKSRMRSYGAAVLKSTDLGETWTDLRDTEIKTPTLYNHQVAIPPLDANIYIYSITLDASGELWAVTLNPGLENDIIWLNHWTGDDWQTSELQSYLPDGLVPVEAMMTIDTSDRFHILTTTVDPEAVGTDSHWGHPSSEVFCLRSDDHAESFTCTQISSTDPTTANWLPAIQRPGPCHPVESPTIMYTHGEVGSGLRPGTPTEIWCLLGT